MPKKKSKKSFWAEEEATMAPPPPPPPPGLLNDDRPETSPYSSGITTLFFGQDQVEYRVPTALLPASIAPTTPYYGSSTFSLGDVDEDVAHTVVHFFHTGKYQTLRTYDMYLYERHAKEHKRALSVYVAAKKYGLDSLEALARGKVCAVDPSLPRVEVLKHLEVACAELPSDDDWLAGYLQSTLQEMFRSAGAASNWMDFNQIDSRFARAVLKGVAAIFASSEAARSNKEKAVHDGERYQMPLAPGHYGTNSQHEPPLDGSESECSTHEASSPKSTLTFSVVSGDEEKDDDVASRTDEDEPADEPQKVDESWYDAPAEEKPAEEIPTTEPPAAFVDEAFACPFELKTEAPPEPAPYEELAPLPEVPEPREADPEDYYPPPPPPLEPVTEAEVYDKENIDGIEPEPPATDAIPPTPPPEPIPVPAVDEFFDWPPMVPSKKSKRKKKARVFEEAVMDVPPPPSPPLCPPPPPCPPEEVWQPVARGCPGIAEHLASREWKDCSTCRSVVLMVARLASNSIHDDIEEA